MAEVKPMTEMDDLVERLLTLADPAGAEAVDHIESLEARLEKATAALRAVVEDYPVAAGTCPSMLMGEEVGYGSILRARRTLSELDQTEEETPPTTDGSG